MRMFSSFFYFIFFSFNCAFFLERQMCHILGGFAVEEEVNNFLSLYLSDLFSYCKEGSKNVKAGQHNISYGYE